MAVIDGRIETGDRDLIEHTIRPDPSEESLSGSNDDRETESIKSEQGGCTRNAAGYEERDELTRVPGQRPLGAQRIP